MGAVLPASVHPPSLNPSSHQAYGPHRILLLFNHILFYLFLLIKSLINFVVGVLAIGSYYRSCELTGQCEVRDGIDLEDKWRHGRGWYTWRKWRHPWWMPLWWRGTYVNLIGRPFSPSNFSSILEDRTHQDMVELFKLSVILLWRGIFSLLLIVDSISYWVINMDHKFN